MADWTSLLQTVKAKMASFADATYPVMPDGSASPGTLSYRRLLSALPVPVQVALLVDQPAPHAGSFSTLCCFDFARPGTDVLTDRGVLRLSELDDHADLLASEFRIDAMMRSFLQTPGSFVVHGAGFRFTHVVPYDARERADDYAIDFLTHLLDSDLVQAFDQHIDFNAKYALPPDRVIDREALLTIDPTSAYFIEIATGKPPTVEERQELIAAIQLIPQVPESVRRTFVTAKRLYVFGHFDYHFFTVANHYAYSALDAALHARWSLTLPDQNKLEHRRNSTQVDLAVVGRTTHAAIRAHCRRENWNVRKLTVNGDPFPHTVAMVLDSLRQQNAINDWQLNRFKEVWTGLRNAYSHLEFAPVMSPDARTLEQSAYEINNLFDSLPLNVG